MGESPLEKYNGFLVDGSVTIGHPNSNNWQSLGTVYSAKTRSPLLDPVFGPSDPSLAAVVAPFPSALMEAHDVSPSVNKPENETPDCIIPVADRQFRLI